jgi:hypothetical protein
MCGRKPRCKDKLDGVTLVTMALHLLVASYMVLELGLWLQWRVTEHRWEIFEAI